MSLANPETQHGAVPMQINTRFGPQEIDPESVIQFPVGLPGFEQLHAFKLFHEEGTSTVFFLQSVDDPSIQLPLVDPDHFQVNYQIGLSDEEAAALQLEDPKDATVLVTISKLGQGGDNGLHANFMGPIVINTKSRIGMQKALNQVQGSVVIRAE